MSSATALLTEAEASIKAEDWDQAIEQLENIKKSQPTELDTYEKLIHVLAIRGKFQSVIRTSLDLISILIETDKLEQADKAVSRTLALSPQLSDAHERRIEIESKRGNIPRVVYLSRELARLCIEQGDGERSIKLLKDALKSEPSNLDISLELAEMYVSHGHIQDGANQFRKAANALEQAGSIAKAAEAYRRMKVVQSDDPEVLLTLGRLYMELGKLDEAEQEFRSVLRHNLDHERALLNLGAVCQLKGGFRSGILAFNRIIQNNPNHTEAKRKIGELHYAQGMMAEAVDYFQQAAQGYLESDDKQQAIECFQIILSIDESSGVAQQGLTNLGAAIVAKPFTPPVPPSPPSEQTLVEPPPPPPASFPDSDSSIFPEPMTKGAPQESPKASSSEAYGSAPMPKPEPVKSQSAKHHQASESSASKSKPKAIRAGLGVGLMSKGLMSPGGDKPSLSSGKPTLGRPGLSPRAGLGQKLGGSKLGGGKPVMGAGMDARPSLVREHQARPAVPVSPISAQFDEADATESFQQVEESKASIDFENVFSDESAPEEQPVAGISFDGFEADFASEQVSPTASSAAEPEAIDFDTDIFDIALAAGALMTGLGSTPKITAVNLEQESTSHQQAPSLRAGELDKPSVLNEDFSVDDNLFDFDSETSPPPQTSRPPILSRTSILSDEEPKDLFDDEEDLFGDQDSGNEYRASKDTDIDFTSSFFEDEPSKGNELSPPSPDSGLLKEEDNLFSEGEDLFFSPSADDGLDFDNSPETIGGIGLRKSSSSEITNSIASEEQDHSPAPVKDTAFDSLFEDSEPVLSPLASTTTESNFEESDLFATSAGDDIFAIGNELDNFSQDNLFDTDLSQSETNPLPNTMETESKGLFEDTTPGDLFDDGNLFNDEPPKEHVNEPSALADQNDSLFLFEGPQSDGDDLFASAEDDDFQTLSTPTNPAQGQHGGSDFAAEGHRTAAPSRGIFSELDGSESSDDDSLFGGSDPFAESDLPDTSSTNPLVSHALEHEPTTGSSLYDKYDQELDLGLDEGDLFKGDGEDVNTLFEDDKDLPSGAESDSPQASTQGLFVDDASGDLFGGADDLFGGLDIDGEGSHQTDYAKQEGQETVGDSNEPFSTVNADANLAAGAAEQPAEEFTFDDSLFGPPLDEFPVEDQSSDSNTDSDTGYQAMASTEIDDPLPLDLDLPMPGDTPLFSQHQEEMTEEPQAHEIADSSLSQEQEQATGLFGDDFNAPLDFEIPEPSTEPIPEAVQEVEENQEQEGAKPEAYPLEAAKKVVESIEPEPFDPELLEMLSATLPKAPAESALATEEPAFTPEEPSIDTDFFDQDLEAGPATQDSLLETLIPSAQESELEAPTVAQEIEAPLIEPEPEPEPEPIDPLSAEERQHLLHVAQSNELEASLENADVATKISSYRKVLEENPDNLVLRTRLADIHLKYGLLEDAVVQYRQVLRRNPDSIPLLHSVIQAEFWNENYEDAGKTLLTLAELHLKRGEHHEALDTLQSVLSLNPSSFEARKELVSVFTFLQESKLATHHLRQLAETALAKKEVSEAIVAFQQLLEISGDPAFEERLAQIYEDQGNIASALEAYRGLVARYTSQERWDDTIRATERIISLEPNSLPERESLIKLYQQSGLIEQAVTEQATLARLYQLQGELGLAISLYEAVIKHQTDNFEARRNLVDAYLDSGQVPFALGQIEPLTEHYLDTKDHATAIALYVRLAEADPENIELQERLVKFYGLAGDLKNAKSRWLNISSLHNKAGNFTRAAEALLKALEFDDTEVDLLYRIAQLYAKNLNDNQSALVYLRKVFSLAPELTEALKMYVDLLLKEELVSEAGIVLGKLENRGSDGAEIRGLVVTSLRSKVDSDPTNLKARFNYGQLCYHLGDLDHAIEQFQQTRRNPNFELMSYNMLGLCFASKSGYMMIDLAVRQFKKGLEVKGHPEQDYLDIRYSLAMVYYQNNRRQDALVELKECYKIDIAYKDVRSWIQRIEAELAAGG